MRNAGSILLLLAVLGLLGGFAWLTQNPETPWLEKAEEWPILGDLAKGFRTAYLGPNFQHKTKASETAVDRPEPGQSEAAHSSPEAAGRAPTPPTRQQTAVSPQAFAATEALVAKTPETPLPTNIHVINEPLRLEEIEVAMAKELARQQDPVREAMRPLHELPFKIDEWRWILPGNTLRAEASPEAEVQERFRSMTYLPILGKRDPWIQVLYRGRQGWIDSSWKPPFSRRKSSRGILRHRYEPVRASDSQLLKRARKMLAIERPSATLGAYTLYTDVEDEELLAFLDLAAGAAEEAYFARYGRLPSGNPKRSVVLFAKHADYLRYSEHSKSLPGTQAGHAGSGVLAFFAEGRPTQVLARTLVHEIGHLLNERAVARFLPPWMEEGLASDLGSVWVEGSPSAKTDRSARGLWRLMIQGTDSRLMQLAANQEAGTLPSVGVLMSLDRAKFHSSPAYAYAHSATFIHFLLDSEDGSQGEAFRKFLKRIAAGHGADPRFLLKQLDMDLDELDQRFRTWLVAEAQASEKRIVGP